MGNEEELLGLRPEMEPHTRVHYRNLSTPWLYERIISGREGHMAHRGPVVVRTGECTEMPLADKYVVRDPAWGEGTHWLDAYQAMPGASFEQLFTRLRSYLENKDIFSQACWVGRDPERRLSVRFITETAWHSLFVRNLYEPMAGPGEASPQEPEFTLIHVPGFRSLPQTDGTRSGSFMVLDPARRLLVIGGSCYAGDIRQAVFSLISTRFSPESVLCMRCSASVGPDGDAAIFMGRKGTGKTTLALDPDRKLLGDHYHGWTADGLCNFERGVYARVLDIDPGEQPGIHASTRTYGTLLENVFIDGSTRRIDLSDRSLTVNPRAAFPLSLLPDPVPEGACGHPRHLFLLSCDALGVLPPIARLTPEMAVYGFLSGYTSDLSRQDHGLAHLDIQFSTCFGASAVTHPSHIFGRHLMEKVREHKVNCWLVNTGWSGEPQGRGQRIPIPLSRALVRAAVSGALDGVETEIDPLFQYEIPKTCPGVPEEILNPRRAAGSEGEYDVRSNRLAREFINDFEKYAGNMPENMREMLSGVLSLDDRFDLLEAFDISV